LKNINLNWIFSKLITICPPVIVVSYLIKRCYLFYRGGLSTVGGDFTQYWVATSLVYTNKISILYDSSLFQKTMEKITGISYPVGFFYPPTFLLMLLPLSFFPYLASLITWLLSTLVSYVLVLRSIAPHRLTIWLSLAFPATLLNIDYCQNGFLSAALLGGGLLLLNRIPSAAGILFGILSYKPQLAALLPVALIAGKHWKALIFSIVSGALMIVISICVMGTEPWMAFLKNIPIPLKILEGGYQGFVLEWYKMISVYATARLCGSGLLVSRVLQITTMLLTLGITTWVWFKKPSFSIQASVLTLCTLLFFPYLFEYDLTILGLAIAWMGWEGYNKGWLRGEKFILVFGWATPVLSKITIKLTGVQITPLILFILLLFALQRMILERKY